MKEIKVRDFIYHIVDKQELEGAAAAFIEYDSKLGDNLDIETFAEVGKQIFNFCEPFGVKAIFIPNIYNLESLNDCKTAIEKLSKELYEFSELQDKLLEEDMYYE